MEEKTAIPQRPQKSPGFAGVLGIFPFGVGALYNGQYTKALLYLVIFAGLTSMQGHGGQPFVGLLLTGFIVFQFFDNIQSARAINAAALGETPVRGRRPAAAGDRVVRIDLLGHRPHRPGRRAHHGQFRDHQL